VGDRGGEGLRGWGLGFPTLGNFMYTRKSQKACKKAHLRVFTCNYT